LSATSAPEQGNHFLRFCAARDRRTRSRLPQVASLHQRRMLPFVRSMKAHRHPSFAQSFNLPAWPSINVRAKDSAMALRIAGQPICVAWNRSVNPFWCFTSCGITATLSHAFSSWTSALCIPAAPPVSWIRLRSKLRNLHNCAMGTAFVFAARKFQRFRNARIQAGSCSKSVAAPNPSRRSLLARSSQGVADPNPSVWNSFLSVRLVVMVTR
jgi:hypothetical protein